jgi:hypothetical protein
MVVGGVVFFFVIVPLLPKKAKSRTKTAPPAAADSGDSAPTPSSTASAPAPAPTRRLLENIVDSVYQPQKESSYDMGTWDFKSSWLER